MFCIKCGHKLEEGSNFCKNCGAQVNNMQNNTSTDSQPVSGADDLFEAGMTAKRTNNISRLEQIAHSYVSKYPNDYKGYYLMLNAFVDGETYIRVQNADYVFSHTVDMALALAKTDREKNEIQIVSNSHAASLKKIQEQKEEQEDIRRQEGRKANNEYKAIKRKYNVYTAIDVIIGILLTIKLISLHDEEALGFILLVIVLTFVGGLLIEKRQIKRLNKFRKAHGWDHL